MVMKNPPLAAYYIAAAASLLGWSEVGLHLAFLLPALGAVLGSYFLAREFCSRALSAAMVVAVSPVFLICSTSVMCDMLMLSFWVWAVYLWVRGLKQGRQLDLAVAAVLTTCCALTKYFGVSLLPLLAVYAWAKQRRLGPSACYLLIPLGVLVLYQWGTLQMYGRGLLSDAAAYASNIKPNSDIGAFSKVIIGLAFAGGCLVSGLFFTPWLSSLWRAAWHAGVTLLLVIPFLFVGHIGDLQFHDALGFRWGVALQLAAFVFGGVSLCTVAVSELLNRRDADTLLLVLWAGGTLVFASWLNWTVNGRSILPMAPAVGILLMRRMDKVTPSRMLAARVTTILPLFLSAVIGLLAAWGDFRIAEAGRRTAEEVRRLFAESKGSVWFQGHWGFQYYMESYGAKPIDFWRSVLLKGDAVVIPSFGSNLDKPPPTLTETRVLEWPSCRLLTLWNQEAGAGFYTAQMVPLPYAFVAAQSEQYKVYEVNQSFGYRGQRPEGAAR